MKNDNECVKCKLLFCFLRFNAIIPFVIVIILTFSGMILDGWWSIRENNKDDNNER